MKKNARGRPRYPRLKRRVPARPTAETPGRRRRYARMRIQLGAVRRARAVVDWSARSIPAIVGGAFPRRAWVRRQLDAGVAGLSRLRSMGAIAAAAAGALGLAWLSPAASAQAAGERAAT